MLFIFLSIIFTTHAFESQRYSQIKYTYNFQDKCQQSPEGYLYNISYNNKTYSCGIPEKVELNKTQEEEFKELQTINETICFVQSNGYFNYTFCLGQNITQTRSENDKLLSKFIIGKKVKSIMFGENMIREEYEGGNRCFDRKTKKKSIIEYTCPSGSKKQFEFKMLKYSEKDCIYTFTVEHPEICKHRVFEDYNIKKTIDCCADINSNFTEQETKKNENNNNNNLNFNLPKGVKTIRIERVNNKNKENKDQNGENKENENEKSKSVEISGEEKEKILNMLKEKFKGSDFDGAEFMFDEIQVIEEKIDTTDDDNENKENQKDENNNDNEKKNDEK